MTGFAVLFFLERFIAPWQLVSNPICLLEILFRKERNLYSLVTSEQLLNLIPQLLVNGPDLVQESPDLHQPGNDGVLLDRLAFCFEQQVEQ